jgi:hypothetical protein
MIGIPPDTPATEVGETVFFLGGSKTPSGVLPAENPYLINVKTVTGGYLDGLTMTTNMATRPNQQQESTGMCLSSVRRLDKNPSACAHLVNHSASENNVSVVSFDWSDIQKIKADGLHSDNNPAISEEYMSHEDESCFGLPNVVRSDGWPRCLLGVETLHYTGEGTNCGVVFCAMHDIDAEQELLLDYGLLPPYPAWAVDWYR